MNKLLPITQLVRGSSRIRTLQHAPKSTLSSLTVARTHISFLFVPLSQGAGEKGAKGEPAVIEQVRGLGLGGGGGVWARMGVTLISPSGTAV